MSPEDGGENDDNDVGDVQGTGASDTGASPVIPIQPTPSLGDKARQQNDNESTAQVKTESPKKVENEENETSLAKAASIDEESAMDDLD